MKKTIILLLSAFFSITVKAQLPDYKTRIKYLYEGINKQLTDKKNGLYYETTDSAKNENPHSWLWPLCALIQATNEMEVLQPGQKYMQQVVNAIDQYYSNKPPFPGYQDYPLTERKSSRFYDDNQWIAIAYLDAYHRTNNKKYLHSSEMIYRFMMGGLDTASGGGLYWKEGDKNTKNTCSNGPGILVALQLYKITKQQHYLNTALTLYKWVNKYLQAPSGVYYDNIQIPSLKIGMATYTYNTGTMLQSNVLLYRLTHDPKYLAEAQRIAKAGKAEFFKNGRLPGNYWFNAVMLRGYIDLFKIDSNKEWMTFFEEDADNIWKTERDTSNLLGPKPAKSLIDQAAMIEICGRLQELNEIK
ncbi:glycoside hydrolase family 76 protein [Mucilaginibacter xinganensis]|nr:glycoside hydrolase family 76 protein [Mucilaginibacter xinganensis]